MRKRRKRQPTPERPGTRKGEDGGKDVPLHSVRDEEEGTAVQVEGLSLDTWDRAYDAYGDKVAKRVLIKKGIELQRKPPGSHRQICNLVRGTGIRVGDCHQLKDLESEVQRLPIAPANRGEVSYFTPDRDDRAKGSRSDEKISKRKAEAQPDVQQKRDSFENMAANRQAKVEPKTGAHIVTAAQQKPQHAGKPDDSIGQKKLKSKTRPNKKDCGT